MIFSTPECSQGVVNSCKIDDFQVLVLTLFWVSFWRCFGSPNGGQGHQKATSKKHVKKMVPKMSPNWSQRGSQNGAKIVKNEVLEAPCFKDGSQEASRPLRDRFWRGFGTHLGSFSSVFLRYFQRFLHAFFSSMLQTQNYNISRSHPTKCLFVPSCIEKLTSERR